MTASRHYAQVVNDLCADVHQDNIKAGWWEQGAKCAADGTFLTIPRNTGELLMLIVSEIAEGMEGHRKNLMDDKLPHRKMLEVELADACIRIFDLAGYEQFDLGGAIAEKRAFNTIREDHKIENRSKVGGKAY